jgi:hypothetical protein
LLQAYTSWFDVISLVKCHIYFIKTPPKQLEPRFMLFGYVR